MQLKIQASLYKDITGDLLRPHPFADERVGFALVKKGMDNDDINQIFVSEYMPVDEENYIYDSTVGAKINSAAIRAILEKALNTQDGVLHVHMHDFPGKLFFSKVDLINIPRLINSFKAVSQKSPHGALLLGQNQVSSLVWLPNRSRPVFVDEIQVMGYPLMKFSGVDIRV